MGLIQSLKKLPIDLGQANLRGTTKGKLIALEHVPDGKGRRALDIGCLEGNQSEWLKAKGYTVTSIDVEKIYPDAIVVDLNEDLPFEDASYDLIWCSKVIEQLRDPQHFRDEAMRLLRPGGRLVLTTPNSYFWFYSLAKCFGKSAAQLQNPTHLQFFSENDMRQLFPDAKHYGFFPYFLWRGRIKRCLGLLTPTFVVIQDRAFEKTDGEHSGLSQDALDEHYRGFYKQQENDFRASNIARLVTQKVEGQGRILDMGCGSCVVTSRLLDLGHQVFAADASPKMIEMARDYLGPKGGHTLELECLTIEACASKYPGAFQEIVCLDVIEHIEDDRAAICGLHQLLPDGGHLILSVPAIPALYSSRDRRVGHYRRYTKDELLHKLQAAGFIIESCRWWNVLGAITKFVCCRILKKEIDESFRKTEGRSRGKAILNSSLNLWFRMVENNVSFGSGLSLIVTARKAKQSEAPNA